MTAVSEPGVTGDTAPGTARDPEAVRVTRGWRRHWRLVLGVAVVALLGVEVVLVAPTLPGALTSLGRARPWWIAAAVLAEAASMHLFARMRHRLLAAAGVHLRMRDTLAAVYVANAMHLTVPGGAAFSTAYACRWLRDRGAGAATIAWTLLAGGLISASALTALAVVASPFIGADADLVSLAEAAVVVALVVGARRLRRRPDLLFAVGRRLLAWRNALLRRPPAQGNDTLERLVGQLGSVRPSARDWTAAAAYAAGNWVFDAACLAASAAAFGVHGSTLPLLLIAYTAGMAVSGISLLPGGIGAVDTAMVLAMAAGGIPAATALSVVLLYRLISLVAVVAAGWLIAAVQGGSSARTALARQR